MTDTAPRDFITALGGPAIVAGRLGVAMNRVGNWSKRGVPWRFRPAIAKMAKERRIKLPADFLDASSEAA